MNVTDALVDEDAFYADIRNAETDAERGEVFTHYVLEPLDSGYEPEKEDTGWYEDEVAPRIADELGLEMPDTEIRRYEDSEQMAYDMMMGTIGRGPLGEFSGREVGELVPDTDEDWGTQLMYDAQLQQQVAPLRMVMTKMGDGISAVTDPYNEFLSGEQTDHVTIAYSAPGIEELANNAGQPYDTALEYVMTHEGVHTVQMAEYSELIDQRNAGIEQAVEYLEDPEQLREDLGDLTITDVLRNPQTLLNGRAMQPLQLPMTLMEGHAEFVTDSIAGTPIHEQGRSNRSLTDRILRVVSFGDKQAQYIDGKEFFETVHDHSGLDAVHYTMKHPPDSMTAVDNPEQWAAHVDQELN